jgi:hypothetical protein
MEANGKSTFFFEINTTWWEMQANGKKGKNKDKK